MRLDKFLCETKNISRKDAKDLVKKGLVVVNSVKAKDSGLNICESSDEILCQGEKLVYEEYVYYMLNKPSGVVSATKDRDTTVIDLLSKENRSDLFPVGRLDKDTVGLLIITNDGALSHHLTSPNHHVQKEYLVKTKYPLTAEDKIALESGIRINDDTVCKPAIVNIIDNEYISITISEGMYHQVKRMLIAVNNEVVFLKRLSIGEVKLDNSLNEGEYRRLTDEELTILKG